MCLIYDYATLPLTLHLKKEDSTTRYLLFVFLSMQSCILLRQRIQ